MVNASEGAKLNRLANKNRLFFNAIVKELFLYMPDGLYLKISKNSEEWLAVNGKYDR